MSGDLQWMEDGAPFSPRFNDRYHSHHEGGLAQSVGSFLHGCGLPGQWQGKAQWRILETGFGLGLNFLSTWHTWRQDPQRCGRLHFISTEAYPVRAAAILKAAQNGYPSLLPLAQALAHQYKDMHSGIHRLRFEDGRVQLTLAIGDAKTMLREQGWQADSVYLDGFSPSVNPDIWDEHTLKAIARCCIAGHTTLATWCVARQVRDTLAQCGFAVERVPGSPPKKHNLRALYQPGWQPKHTAADARLRAFPDLSLLSTLPAGQRQCVVIGAGLAGAGMAWHMAQRGWQVTVLDQATMPAAGASALPAGLFAPHVSPDDAPLSRLTRAGLRATTHAAAALLQRGQEWDNCGVLEHRIGKKAGLPPVAAGASDATHIPSTATRLATAAERMQCGLEPPAAAPAASLHPALWHSEAGWLKPARLVRALLQHPNIRWQANSRVHAIAELPNAAPHGLSGHACGGLSIWQAQDAEGNTLAQAPCMVVASAFESAALLAPWRSQPSTQPLPLNRVRGQVAYGFLPNSQAMADAALPMTPVNGKGSFVCVPAQNDAEDHAQWLWVSGGTFERDTQETPPTGQERAKALAENRQRLPTLMPAAGAALAQQLFTPEAQTWWGMRCTVPDRTPAYGPVSSLPNRQGLLVAAGLGSRGISLALLCADILASAIHNEPLPVEKSLARLVSTQRFAPSA